MHCLSLSTHLVMMFTILRVFRVSKRPLLEKIDSLLPIGLMILYFFINFTYCEMAWNAPGIILFISGAYFCLCSTKIIISNVTKQKFSTFEDMGLHVPFLFSLIMLPLHSMWSVDKPAEQRKIGEIWILSFSFVSNIFVYFVYVANVIRQITSYLDIECLSIKKQQNKVKTK